MIPKYIKYLTQILIDHGRFKCNFSRFNLVNAISCGCSVGGEENVAFYVF